MNVDRTGFRLGIVATVLAFFVATLGSYVRVSDAGLSCPDWPFCYGQITTPDTHEEISKANAAFPDRPVEVHKGRKEMLHRYLASTLGLVILAIAVRAWIRRREEPRINLPTFLLVLVVFQGLLGMWTVTLLVHPVIVTGHLIGGLSTFALSLSFALTSLGFLEGPAGPTWMKPAALGLLAIVAVQILLGGWTSTHYSALACTAFPGCHPGAAWPDGLDFRAGFQIFREVGVNYEGGVLEPPARMAVHMAHRLGALTVLLVAGVVGTLAVRLGGAFRTAGLALLGAVSLQVVIGISAVLLLLPKPIAVLHNAGAGLVVGAATALVVLAFRRPR